MTSQPSNYSIQQELHTLSSLYSKPSEQDDKMASLLLSLATYINQSNQQHTAILTYVHQSQEKQMTEIDQKIAALYTKETKAREALRLLFLNEVARSTKLNHTMQRLSKSHEELTTKVLQLKGTMDIMKSSNDSRISKLMQQVSQIDVSQTTLETDCVRLVKNGKEEVMSKMKALEVVCGSSQKDVAVLEKKIIGLTMANGKLKTVMSQMEKRMALMENRLNDVQRGGNEYRGRLDANREVTYMTNTLQSLRTPPKRF